METKELVCGLDWAKPLKELGVKQNSIFYWVRDRPMQGWESDRYLLELGGITNYQRKYGYSAFTDAELEREIFKIIGNRYDFAIYFSPDGGVWGDETFSEMYEVDIIDWFDREESLMERADTGANAKAKILVRLIKNKITDGE